MEFVNKACSMLTLAPPVHQYLDNQLTNVLLEMLICFSSNWIISVFIHRWTWKLWVLLVGSGSSAPSQHCLMFRENIWWRTSVFLSSETKHAFVSFLWMISNSRPFSSTQTCKTVFPLRLLFPSFYLSGTNLYTISNICNMN